MLSTYMYLTENVESWTRKHRSSDSLGTPKLLETTECGMSSSRSAISATTSSSMRMTSKGVPPHLSQRQKKARKMCRSVWRSGDHQPDVSLPGNHVFVMVLMNMLATLHFRQLWLKSSTIEEALTGSNSDEWKAAADSEYRSLIETTPGS